MQRRLGRRRAALFLALASTIAIATGCRSPAKPEEPLVFAAASTAETLTEIGKQFEADRSIHVRFSFGASRDLARQVRAGAPADIIVSADAETIDAMEKDGFVLASDRRTLVSNSLVVIVPNESPTSGAGAVRVPDDLKSVPHLAIGDPATVPAGSYAAGWLKNVGLWEAVKDRVVPSLDVRAALAAVEAGRAEAGVVYRTDAAVSTKVRVAFAVPPERAPPISYVAARLRASKTAAAIPFFEYLFSQNARTVFLQHGFAAP